MCTFPNTQIDILVQLKQWALFIASTLVNHSKAKQTKTGWNKRVLDRKMLPQFYQHSKDAL